MKRLCSTDSRKPSISQENTSVVQTHYQQSKQTNNELSITVGQVRRVICFGMSYNKYFMNLRISSVLRALSLM